MLEATFGGQDWDKSLEQIARDCRACKLTKSMPAVAPSIHGCGHPAPGNVYTSILLVRLKAECFLYLSTPILNGQKLWR